MSAQALTGFAIHTAFWPGRQRGQKFCRLEELSRILAQSKTIVKFWMIRSGFGQDQWHAAELFALCCTRLLEVLAFGNSTGASDICTEPASKTQDYIVCILEISEVQR